MTIYGKHIRNYIFNNISKIIYVRNSIPTSVRLVTSFCLPEPLPPIQTGRKFPNHTFANRSSSNIVQILEFAILEFAAREILEIAADLEKDPRVRKEVISKRFPFTALTSKFQEDQTFPFFPWQRVPRFN